MTGGMLHTGTYQIFPAHCQMPTISEGELTIQAATELLRELKASAPETVAQKVRHIKILRNLDNILKNREPPRVNDHGPPRVETRGEPRVGATGTTADPTHPAKLRTAKRVHQRKTRNNMPISATHDVQHSPSEPPARPVPAAPPAATPTAEPRRTRSSTATPSAARPNKPAARGTGRPKKKRVTRRQVARLVDEQLRQDAISGVNLQKNRQTQ